MDRAIRKLRLDLQLVIRLLNSACLNLGAFNYAAAALCNPPLASALLELRAVEVTNGALSTEEFARVPTYSPHPIEDPATSEPAPAGNTNAGPEQWPPPGTVPNSEWFMPGWGATIWRGMRGRCPHCGLAPIFNGYLRVHQTCASCAAPLGKMPADDTPPYIAMVIVLHFVGIFTVLSFRFHLHPNGIEIALLLGLLVLICMGALRVAKGAVIGILLKLDNNRDKQQENANG